MLTKAVSVVKLCWYIFQGAVVHRGEGVMVIHSSIRVHDRDKDQHVSK